MSRYIDADELIISIKKECPMCELNQSCDSCMVTEKVKDIHRFADLHRADVKPIVRGEWVEVESFMLGRLKKCTICKGCVNIKSDFCPHCGADMRGESE